MRGRGLLPRFLLALCAVLCARGQVPADKAKECTDFLQFAMSRIPSVCGAGTNFTCTPECTQLFVSTPAGCAEALASLGASFDLFKVYQSACLGGTPNNTLVAGPPASPSPPRPPLLPPAPLNPSPAAPQPPFSPCAATSILFNNTCSLDVKLAVRARLPPDAAVQPGYCLEANATPGGWCTREWFTVGSGEMSRGLLITTSNNSFQYYGYSLAADGSPVPGLGLASTSVRGYQGVNLTTGEECLLNTTSETTGCAPFQRVAWTGCLESYTQLLECNITKGDNQTFLSSDYLYVNPSDSPNLLRQFCFDTFIEHIAADRERVCAAELLADSSYISELCPQSCQALWQDYYPPCIDTLPEMETAIRGQGIQATLTSFSKRCLSSPSADGTGDAPAPAPSAAELYPTYTRAYEDCAANGDLTATNNLLNQATTTGACGESMTGYALLDGRNATSFQCPPACKTQLEKWSPACYGLLNYSMNTMYVRTSSFFTYFFRQSDGTPWNLASVANYTASFVNGCMPAAYLAGDWAEGDTPPLPVPLPAPAPAPGPPADSGGSSVGVAVGAAIGGLAAVAAAAGGFVWWRRRRPGRRLAGTAGDPEKAHVPAGGGNPAAIDSYLDAGRDGGPGPLGSALMGAAVAGQRSGSLGLDSADKLLEKSFGSGGTPKSVGAGHGPSIGSLSGPTSSIPSDGGLLMSYIHSQLSSGGRPASTPCSPGPGIDARWHIPFSQLKVHEIVGQGSFGQVYRATWAGHSEVAVKLLIDKAPAGGSPADALTAPSPVLAAMEEEAELMLSLRHSNCCAIMGVVTTPPCLVTEFMSRGSLTEVLRVARADDAAARALTWPLRLQMALDAAKGMAYLHGRRPPIVHRDLKSPNLLVDRNWTVKVADFNLSKHLSESLRSSSQAAMNPRWLAPEVMQGERATQAADVFSFGVVMWELLMWEVPWSSANPWQLVGTVTQGGRLPLPASPEALPGPPSTRPTPAQLAEYCELMSCCWAHTPAHRPPFGDVVQCLRAMLAAAEAAESADAQ